MLYLSHRIPYPPNKGEKIRSFNQIKYLSETGHDIHLVSLVDQKRDLQYESNLLKWCKSVHLEYRSPLRAKFLSLPWLLSGLPLSVPYFYSRGIQQHVDTLLQRENIRTIFCFSSPMGEYVLRSRASEVNNKLLILDFCDLDSDKWRQYSKSSTWPMSWIHAREASLLLKYEAHLNHFFDHSIFISRAEAELFQPYAPRPERITIVPNGVDHAFFSPESAPQAPFSSEQDGSRENQESPPSRSPVLLFTGAMDYEANVDGVVWFCHTALPELQKRFPGLKMYIVGANPSPAVQRLAGESIIVTGYVEDIRTYYRMADVCVVPLRLARGVQNKVLEALSMAKPVITTSKVLQGVKASPGQDLLVADSGQEFVDQALNLLNNPDQASAFGRRGREFILESYDWTGNLQGLRSLLGSQPDPRRGAPPVRGKLNPAFLVLYICFMLLASLWPMAETSPGASITYRINPGLQNILHLPVFAAFSLLLLDFLKNFSLSLGKRLAVFLISGLSLCFVLEGMQLFVPGRYISLSDLLTNISGILLGLAIHGLWFSKRSM